METGVSTSRQEHGIKISLRGQDVTSKKEAGKQPTAGNGEMAIKCLCLGAPTAYSMRS